MDIKRKKYVKLVNTSQCFCNVVTPYRRIPGKGVESSTELQDNSQILDERNIEVRDTNKIFCVNVEHQIFCNVHIWLKFPFVWQIPHFDLYKV